MSSTTASNNNNSNDPGGGGGGGQRGDGGGNRRGGGRRGGGGGGGRGGGGARTDGAVHASGGGGGSQQPQQAATSNTQGSTKNPQPNNPNNSNNPNNDKRGGGGGGQRNNNTGRGGGGGGGGGNRRRRGRGGGGGGGGGGSTFQDADSVPSAATTTTAITNKNASLTTTTPEAPLVPELDPAQVLAAAQAAQAQAEQRRLEEQAAAVAAAAAARLAHYTEQCQQLQRQVQTAMDHLTLTYQTTLEHVHSRTNWSTPVLTQRRLELESNKKLLKSDLKKCTAFIKKIKSGALTTAKVEDVTRDVSTLNLSRYVEEVVAACLEAKWKMVDVPVVIALWEGMQERYPEFMTTLLPAWWNVIAHKPTDEAMAKLRRVYMRLVTEAILRGLWVDCKPLLKFVEQATGGGGKDGTYHHVTDAHLMVVFCKAASFEMLTVTPKSIRMDIELIQREMEKTEQVMAAKAEEAEAGAAAAAVVSEDDDEDAKNEPMNEGVEAPISDVVEIAADNKAEKESTVMRSSSRTSISTKATDENDFGPIVMPESMVSSARETLEKIKEALQERAVPTDVSEVLLKHCLGAYQTLATSLRTTHGRLLKLEKRCEQDRLLSGTLPEVREKGLSDARKLCESLVTIVKSLSDVLDQPMPELKEEETTSGGGDMEGTGGNSGVELWKRDEEGGGADDTGPFDDEETRAFYCDVPDLLTTVPPALLGMTLEQIEQKRLENLQKYGNDATAAPVPEEDGSDAVAPASEADLDAEEAAAEAAAAEKDASGSGGGNVGETEENKDTPHYKLTVLLEQDLPECNRREAVDEIAEKFCTNHCASKNSRKRLSKALFLVPRTRLDLLPYYARLAAIVDRVYADVSTPLVTELEQQFHGQAKFKKNQNLESRLKTARYIGELTKFRVAPPIVALRCLRRCLDDFSGGNIDVACCLLEYCGRYLFRTPHTSARLTSLMETMMRISKAKHLDERSLALINSAFYMVKPPASGPRKQAKVYPPLEAYLRHLLMVRLEPTPSSVSFVTKQLIRFPWNDPSRQCGLLVCKYMLKTCRKGRYKSIQAIANVAASLRRQKPEVFTRLVDAVLEELQWSLEHPDFRDQQRMIAYTRLLGELHCASLAPAQLIFHELYHFINFGHQIPEALRAASEKSSKEEGSEQAGLPSFNSTGKVSQTIHEDEELDEADIQPAKETPVAPKPVAVSKHSKFDPRVPSALDPPNSVIRIKLVCTLLEVVTKSLVTRNNIPKMEVFLAAFQRYLFTKPLLPAEIEFSLLDVFDSIDSRWKKAQQDGAINVKKDADVAAADKDQSQGFTRYTKWLDAHNATVAAEEADAVLEARMQAMLESTAGESQVDSEMLSVDDMATEDPDDEDSDQESIDDPLSTSAKDSYVDEEMESDMDSDEEEKLHESEESEEEESEGSNESEEEEDDMSQEEEFDEEAYMLQLEEEAFERELRRVTMEALEKGKNAVRGQVADTMPSGSQFIKKKTGDVAQETPGSLAVALGGKEGVTFQLLKKGNRGKMEVKQLIVPVDTNLAKQANKQDDEAARERDLIKARVLQYEAESAESEYAGGNVYLEQEKLQVIRNRPLSMEEIDKNFGTSGGNRRSDKSKPGAQPSGGRGATAPPAGGRGAVAPPSGGRGAAAPASGGRGASAGTANAGGGGQGSGGESSAVFTGRGGRAGRGRGNAGGRKLFR